jgi:hypothetical protein
MSYGYEVIPGPDKDFNDFFKVVCQYTRVKVSAPKVWTHIPETEVVRLESGYADWYTFYAPTLGDHTRAETAAKNMARGRDEPILRDFIQTWFRRFPDIVTDADLIAMGIAPVDHTRSHIGRPKTRPVFIIRVKGLGVLSIVFWDELTPKSRRRPYGMNGAVVSIAVSHDGHVVKKFAEFTHTELATHTPYDLHFSEEDRGKTVYLALQWQNESGERGDPSEIQSAIIP